MSEINPYERTTVYGSWEYDESGNIAWRKVSVRKIFNLTLHEWIASPEIIEHETPEQRGLKKEISTCFIFKKEIPNLEEFGDVKIIWYKLPVSWKVNGNQGDNIWLCESQGKVYLLSINPDNPQCIEAPHETTENVTFKKKSPVKTTPKEAQSIIKSGNRYLYGKVVGSGKEVEFLTVV